MGMMSFQFCSWNITALSKSKANQKYSCSHAAATPLPHPIHITTDVFPLFCFRAGLSNYLYLCTLPPKQKTQGKEPKEVLLRVYGEIFYEGDAPLLDTVVFSLLSERRHAPKLYGVFREGRLEQYIPVSETLSIILS